MQTTKDPIRDPQPDARCFAQAMLGRGGVATCIWTPQRNVCCNVCCNLASRQNQMRDVSINFAPVNRITLHTMAGYEIPGPWRFNVRKVHVSLPASDDHQHAARSLPVTLTIPEAPTNESESRERPLVFLFNGFKTRAGWYSCFSKRLASYGYVVLQYDTPILEILPDNEEMRYFPLLLSWARQEVQRVGSPLQGRIAAGRVGVAGHSRGAKLAALAACGYPATTTAFLMDPVDNTDRTPVGPLYPSACAALAESTAPVAVLGAGVTGPCSPEGSNYKEFYQAVPSGSWLATLPNSGHSQLFDAGCLLNHLGDCLCSKGSVSRKDTLALAMPLLVAWMDVQLKGEQGFPASLHTLSAADCSQQQATTLELTAATANAAAVAVGAAASTVTVAVGAAPSREYPRETEKSGNGTADVWLLQHAAAKHDDVGAGKKTSPLLTHFKQWLECESSKGHVVFQVK